jgi:hydroxyacylglutathione hydrolase
MSDTLTIEPVACLKDNYAYLVMGAGFTAVVDPSESEPVIAALAKRGLRLTHILNTHHHNDHVGGNLALKEKFGVPVIAPEKDRHRIPGIDTGVSDGDVLNFGAASARVLEIPAHTSGHIAFWFEQDKSVFTGDTLFAMGCGRLFEGDAPTMFNSLTKLARLPDDTAICCGHEYTEANGRFALSLEPGNVDVKMRMDEVRAMRAQGLPTVPSAMGLEKRTNPFLRAFSAEIRKNLGMDTATDVAVFAEMRKRKDSF